MKKDNINFQIWEKLSTKRTVSSEYFAQMVFRTRIRQKQGEKNGKDGRKGRQI